MTRGKEMKRVLLLVVMSMVFFTMQSCKSVTVNEVKQEEVVETPKDSITVQECPITVGTKTIYGKLYKPNEIGIYPAVILSHGYNSASSDNDAECRRFAENGYVAYAYDFCGGSTRSKSSGKTEDMTLFTEKQDLLDVYAYISSLGYINKKQIFLFGASQGGMVSAMVAEELQQKVAGMILYFPAFCIPDDWRAKYPSVDSIPETFDFWGMTLGRNFVTSIHDYYVFDSIGSYANDVLIIYGENDPIVSMGYMTKAKETYKSIDLLVLKNEGHGFSYSGGEKARSRCVEFLQAHKGRVFEDNAYKEIPSNYWDTECEKKGKIVSFSYKTCNNKKEGSTQFTKEALVYVPYGFDENDGTKKYNVLYLMHGGSDSPRWFFNGAGEESSCKTIIDNLIADGRMAPCIICAVSYYTEYSNDATTNCGNFYLELTKDIMPIFEKQFHINTTREHRAFSGFSMGAMTTWSVFEHCLDQFAYFLPISGDCWALGGTKGGVYADITAKYLAGKVASQGFTGADFKIYSGCGTNDIAEPNLTPQITAMKKLTDTFVYGDNFANANFYQCIIQNGGHDRSTVLDVLYNGLPKMFD